MLRGALFVAVAILSFSGWAWAAPRELIAGGEWPLTCADGADASASVEPSQIRLSIHRLGKAFYSIQLQRPIEQGVAAGNVLHLTFRARSSTGNRLRYAIQQTQAPYAAMAAQMVKLEKDWKPYELVITTSGFAAEEYSVRLQAGFAVGEIELADIRLTNDGGDPADEVAKRELAPARIAERIERYRKREVRVVVVDPAGKPVPGAAVHLQQTRHAFLFGCNFFLLNPADQTPAQQAYRQRFEELFNYATLPFYWLSFEFHQGQRNYRRLDEMAQWCAEHHITTKGHPLIWHQSYPAWAPATADGAIVLLHERVADLIQHFRGSINYWDVVNEANSPPHAPPNGVDEWISRDGPAGMVGTALGWARRAAVLPTTQPYPPETFICNDYETGQPNVALLRQLAARRALPDAIGIQSHMHQGEWPAEQVWMVAERFAQFHRPVHFTETTVLSGEHRAQQQSTGDWPTTDDGERRQAEYLEQFYTVLFSNPSVEAITYWDLSDHSAWLNAPAGLLHKDMSPKPAYSRLKELIHRQWWTDVEIPADASGACDVKAFLGDYRISAKDAAGHEAVELRSLGAGDGPLVIKITLPAASPARR